jgi:glycerol-3-phosphate cytidylyltransferase
MAFMKRVLVDMSATLIHHGHIRILKKASKFGKVIVALTVDEEILKVKGYLPELEYSFRKEILESIRYVTEVVPSNWLIDESFLNLHRIDLLVHGDDNSNLIPKNKLLILPRTKGISSKDLRLKISSNFQERPELLNKNE